MEKVHGLPRSSRRAISRELHVKIELDSARVPPSSSQPCLRLLFSTLSTILVPPSDILPPYFILLFALEKYTPFSLNNYLALSQTL